MRREMKKWVRNGKRNEEGDEKRNKEVDEK